jgi:hypothetical protein
MSDIEKRFAELGFPMPAPVIDDMLKAAREARELSGLNERAAA